jgi:hypothetical protein
LEALLDRQLREGDHDANNQGAEGYEDLEDPTKIGEPFPRHGIPFYPQAASCPICAALSCFPLADLNRGPFGLRQSRDKTASSEARRTNEKPGRKAGRCVIIRKDQPILGSQTNTTARFTC